MSAAARPKRITLNRLLFIPPVLLGIGVLIFAAQLRTVRIREELDRQTRDSSVVVAIENPVDSNDCGPPPLNGSMCEVELRGSVIADQIVIPLSALHDDHVFVLDADSRLQRRSVNVEKTQANCVVLRSGLNEGDTLVVSDPTPAIIGQLIRAESDESLAATLRQQASGEERLR